jgi:hypothetical protein
MKLPPGEKYNPEGYKDLTAYEAMQNIADEEERVNALVKTIKTILRLAGFELIHRVEIRSIRTRREYR